MAEGPLRADAGEARLRRADGPSRSGLPRRVVLAEPVANGRLTVREGAAASPKLAFGVLVAAGASGNYTGLGLLKVDVWS